MLEKKTEKIFILGSERSGSTWVTNLLDANPFVITYLEPFADYANLFNSFPPRYIYLDCLSSEQERYIKHAFSRLFFHKYPYSYRPGRSKYLRQLDKLLVSKFSKSKTKEIFELLSLNNLNQSCKYSNDHIKTEVIKELRLNFKVGVLKQCFPDARYIVSIRHPQLQVESILSWLSKNRLMELRRNLDYFLYYANADPRFHRFDSILRLVKKYNSIEATLYAYWIINYDMLLADLERFDCTYEVFKNEDLITNGLSKLEAIKEFDDFRVTRYYEKSTKSNVKEIAPTKTLRNSRKYLKHRLNALNKNDKLEELKNCHDSKSIRLYF